MLAERAGAFASAADHTWMRCRHRQPAALFGHRRDAAYRRRRSLLNALSGAVRAGRRQLRAQFRTRRRKDAEAFLALSPNPSDAHEIDASTARPTLKPCTENSALLQVITLTVLTTRGQLLVRSRGSGQATPYDANHGQKCDFLGIFQCFTRHPPVPIHVQLRSTTWPNTVNRGLE